MTDPTHDPGAAGAPSSEPAQDAHLVQRARAGDLAAFERVADARLGGAWRLARAILGDDDAATDTVAVAFAAAWRELPRLDDVSRFDDWLDRILLAECRMRLVAAPSGRDGGAPPPGLLDATLASIRSGPPRPPTPTAAPRGRSASGSASWAPTVLLALGSVMAVALAVTLAVPWIRDRVAPAPPVSPSPVTVATPDPSPTPPTAKPGPAASRAPAVAADALGVGVLAMVSLDGDNLRVRSAPGTADDTTILQPFLPAGTRLLVVGGPVEADGYTWWEVRTDGELVDLFGWVAEGGEETPWIAPTAPRCVGDLDAAAAATLTRIDFLVCHGDATLRLQAPASALRDDGRPAGSCGWVRDGGGCEVRLPWLLLPTTEVAVPLARGGTRDLRLAVPPDLRAALRDVPPSTMLTLTVALDSPDAAACQIRDADTGDPLLTDDQAVTECRLQFVVQEAAFRQ